MDTVKIFYCLIIWIVTSGPVNRITNQLSNNLGVKCIRIITHMFEEKNDPLSGPEIFEVQAVNGLSILFGRYIHKDVCISGECKMIRLWVFWDGVGNFLGVHVPHDDPLTKSDHTLFDSTDYKKLETILRDTASLLRELNKNELTLIPDALKSNVVDGITSATNPILSDFVVEDAVFTTHTLWHTVYGPVQKEIFKILNSKINYKYLKLLFDSRNSAYISWAISCVENFPEYHHSFYLQIINNINSDNLNIAYQSLSYFDTLIFKDSIIQDKFINLMPKVEQNIRHEIFWKFVSLGDVSENILLKLITLFEEGILEARHLRLIYALVTKEYIESNSNISNKISALLKHENRYIRNITRKLLIDKTF